MVDKNPEWKKNYGKAWDDIAEAQKKLATRYRELFYRSLAGSRYGSLGLQIVRYVAEIKKEDGKRLDGFHDSQLQSLQFQMFSKAPIYPDLEEFVIAARLEEVVSGLGKDDEYVKMMNGNLLQSC